MANPVPDEQTLHQPSNAPLDGPSLDQRPAALLAQLRVEQQREWQLGRPVTVESLLQRHPNLGADSDAVVELAYNEFRLRTEAGETPTADEYLRRFPDHAGPLRHQFALLAALRSKAAAAETPNAAIDGSTITHGPVAADPSETIARPAPESDSSATISRDLGGPV